jgi:hypothetical protein
MELVKEVVAVVKAVVPVVEPTFKPPQVKVPVPAIVAAVLALEEVFKVTSPVTVKVTPLTVSVAAVVLVKVNEAIFVVKLVLKVGWLVPVDGMTTISVATVPGVLEPEDGVQFAALFQAELKLPFHVYVICAFAFQLILNISKAKTNK